MKELREKLTALAELLEKAEKDRFSRYIRTQLEGSDETVRDFLRSNELWGGAGSIADEAGVECDDVARRNFWAAMSSLGKAQISAGVTNPRTPFWTDAFAQWLTAGI
ncbi:MAG: hypothetical protein KF715_07300 [Candidatus Didemnitutus sp.]|nr:hypothetical protein [Candidatus Didemnitutus sp.]